MEKKFDEDTDILFETISSIKNEKDCMDFFIDLCTIKEIKEMSKRFKAAILLSKGYSFKDIINKTGLSSATLSRVNKSLQYGSGGYEKQIKKRGD